ncbi:cobalamin-binding protein [Halobacillus massiliensis]|uniref:cobalamin-binding protein n=1 Tax=Halobacillus massiliensis TaxID=1926286 RepID=UPI0009E3850B|nr:cobalamin-binding protein [Halobacillus massiliensis]
MRIVSICPSNTEIVAYLELDELLIGVDNYSDYPETVKELPQLGPDLSIDIEKVEELQPDLVLASLSVPGMEANIKGLEERGIPYIILNPGTLNEIAEDIIKTGEALGYKELGKLKADLFLKELEKYKEKNRGEGAAPSLYWEWWPKPIFTPGGGNWLTEITALAGGQNIFADRREASLQMEWEDVRKADPDHICMVWVGVKEDKMRPELLKKRPGWNEMKAIQKGKIHVLEESLYCRPSPRLLQGLEKLDTLLNLK